MKKADLIYFEKLDEEIDSFMKEFLDWYSKEVERIHHSYDNSYSIKENIISINFTDVYGCGGSVKVPLDLLFYNKKEKKKWAVEYKAEKERQSQLKKREESRAKKEAKERQEMEEYHRFLELKKKYEGS